MIKEKLTKTYDTLDHNAALSAFSLELVNTIKNSNSGSFKIYNIGDSYQTEVLDQNNNKKQVIAIDIVLQYLPTKLELNEYRKANKTDKILIADKTNIATNIKGVK